MFQESNQIASDHMIGTVKNKNFRSYSKLSSKQASKTDRKSRAFKSVSNRVNQSSVKHIDSIVKNLEKTLQDLKNFQKNMEQIPTLSNAITTKLKKQMAVVKPKLSAQKEISTHQSKNHLTTLSQSTTINVRKGHQNQNGSTMLSLVSGDVEELKKMYSNVHGLETSNINELYNFYKKSIDKNSRINGSLEFSHIPHQSQVGVEDVPTRKKTSKVVCKPGVVDEKMNVIVQEERLQSENKENLKHEQNTGQFEKGRNFRLQNKNSGQILRAIDFVKSKRPLVNYIYKAENKKTGKNEMDQLNSSQQQGKPEIENIRVTEKEEQNLRSKNSTQKMNKGQMTPETIMRKNQQNLHCMLQSIGCQSFQKDLSNSSSLPKQNQSASKYPSPIQRHSQLEISEKGSLDKSSQIQSQDREMISQFGMHPEREKSHKQSFHSEESPLEQQAIPSTCQKKSQIVSNQNCSLSGSSIAFNTSPKIIDLEFIPLEF